MPNGDNLFLARHDTPIGVSHIVFDGEGAVRAYGWYDDKALSRFGAMKAIEGRDHFGLIDAMEAYFAGDIHAIDRIAVRFGGTPFQNAVWRALRDIPAGETLSYGGLAKRLDAPKAMRAVGLANGANPVAVIVPCHRVIGADGSLTGYGGGIERKKWLLAHEARHTGLFGSLR